MQAHARVCEENKLEEKNNTYWNNFVVKGASSKDHIGRVGRRIKMILSRMIHHSVKVLVLKYSNSCVSQVVALVTEMNAKTHGPAGS